MIFLLTPYDLTPIAVGTGLILVPIFVLIVWKNYKLKRRLGELLNNHQAETVETSKLHKRIEALERIIKHQEQEKEQTAKQLHDDIGGILSLAFIESEKELASDTSKSGLMLRDATDQLRKISQEMMPEAFYHFGLEDALKDLASFFSQESLLIETHFNGSSNDINEKYLAWIIYKMIREIIGKILQLSGVSKVSIHLKYYGENGLELIMDDDADVPLLLTDENDHLDFINACTTILDGRIEKSYYSTSGNNLQLRFNRIL